MLDPDRNRLITNATLVNEGRRFEADLRIRDGRIDAIAPSLAAREGESVLDARGRWLLPGLIDDQVHFREPGLTAKGDIATESAACVAGGITSFMDMPNTRPPAVTHAALADKYALAAGRARANYAFYFGATNDNIEAIRTLDPASCCGIKVFMGASTGNMLVDDPVVLDAIFRDTPVRLITHCEDTPMIDAAMAAAKAIYGDDVPVEMHPDIRSREACLKSSMLAVALAKKHGTRLHVLHVSTAEELAQFEPGPLRTASGQVKRITAETCIHYLLFDRSDYPRLGNFIKCNPAIKDASDREALTRALTEGRIDVLATDHAPHTLAEKQQRYIDAPSGLPLVQYALVAALELVHDGKLALETVVERFAHAPATLFNVRERGFLREGYAADLVLVDPAAPFTVRREDVLSKCGWSPFEGRTFRSSIASTFVNGMMVWDGERLHGAPNGQRLRFV